MADFTLSGPDGDGFVWLHMKLEDGTETDLNLGEQKEAAEVLSQKLGEWDGAYPLAPRNTKYSIPRGCGESISRSSALMHGGKPCMT